MRVFFLLFYLNRITERELSTLSFSFGKHQECEFAASVMSSYAAPLLIFFLENSKICDWWQIKLSKDPKGMVSSGSNKPNFILCVLRCFSPQNDPLL